MHSAPTVPVLVVPVPVPVLVLGLRVPVPRNGGFTHGNRNVRPRGGAPLPGGWYGIHEPLSQNIPKNFHKKFSYSGPVACAFGVLTLLSKVG